MGGPAKDWASDLLEVGTGMSIMDLWQKVQSGANRAASEAEKQVSIVKLNLDVNAAKGDIRRKLAELGTLALQLQRQGELSHPDAASIVREIGRLEARVADLEREIAEVRAKPTSEVIELRALPIPRAMVIGVGVVILILGIIMGIGLLRLLFAGALLRVPNTLTGVSQAYAAFLSVGLVAAANTIGGLMLLMPVRVGRLMRVAGYATPDADVAPRAYRSAGLIMLVAGGVGTVASVVFRATDSSSVVPLLVGMTAGVIGLLAGRRRADPTTAQNSLQVSKFVEEKLLPDEKAIAAMSPPKVSKLVQEKLLPGEKAIAEISAGGADFVASDKRLLRFSAGGCEQLEHAQMSGISYKVRQGKRLAVRILFGFFTVVLLWLAVAVWLGAVSHSVRNVSIFEATIFGLFCLGLAGLCIWGMVFFDFGYYQVESETLDKAALRGWRLDRPHPHLIRARARVDGFVVVVRQRIASSQKPS